MRLSIAVLEDELKKRGCSFWKRPDRKSAAYEECGMLAELIEAPAGQDGRELLLEVFLDYSQWETKMLAGIVRQSGIQQFIDMAAEKLVNPIALLDPNCMILAKSKNYPKEFTNTIWDDMKGEYFPMDKYYSLKEIRNFSEKLNRSPKKYVLYQAEKDPEHTYYASQLRMGNHALGSIGTISLYGPITEGQVDILYQVKEYFQMYFSSQRQEYTFDAGLSQAFTRFLEGESPEKSGLLEELNRRRWKKGEPAQLLTFACPVPFYSEMETALFSRRIRLQFPGCLLAVQDGMILVAARQVEADLNNPTYRKELERFLEQYDLYVGCSFLFCEWRALRAACIQSSFAARRARDKGKKRFLRYQDCQMEHLLWAAGKQEDILSFCDPDVLRLWNSGKDSDRFLVECLRVYLLNGRNLADTARALKLHRNTVVYRVEKLAALLHVDFHALSEEQAFSYLFTCLLLKAQKTQPAR